MAKLTMKRIQIAALMENRKEILDYLQRKGIVEVSDEENESLKKINTAETISQLEKYINTAIQAKAVIDEYAPQKKPLLSSFCYERELGKDEFEKNAAKADTFLKYCWDLIDSQKKIADCKSEISRTQIQIDALKDWLSLDIPMVFNGTKFTKCFIGTIPGQKEKDYILQEIWRLNPELETVYIEIISSFQQQTYIAVFSHNDTAVRTLNALREIGFTQPSDPSKQEPRIRLEQFESYLKECEKEINDNLSLIKKYAAKADDIKFLIDYFTIRRDKYIALNKLGLTKNTFVINGYIPEKYVEKCVNELKAEFTVEINVVTPEDDEDVPVLLKNSEFVTPVESITEMYALPAKNDLDPNPVMSFFYYFLFGLMVSDAGYGLVMIIFTSLILRKDKLKSSMKKTLKMFFYCGISTLIWGALFGSWFGDIVQVISKQFFNTSMPSLAIWFEPVSDPMKLLLFSFAFGLLHLFSGLGIKFASEWKEGNKKDAILDVFPICIFVLGAAPLAVQILASVPAILTTIGKYMALVGIVLIILTSARSSKNIFARLGGGLYGLYGIASGYLSDVLSYSRLLALGLATGSIASVINLMGSMSSNPVLKGIILTIVFIVGHSLNIAINLLGAYVHTNRLQFVEFFSKFYEGGGRAFSPLKVNTKYIIIKEDVQNG